MRRHRLVLLAAIALASTVSAVAIRAGEPVLQVYMDDRKGGGVQKARLYVPKNVKTVRGILIDMGSPHGADRNDFQAFAEANDFAVLSTLMAWPKTLNDDLTKLVARLAGESKHPELVHAPWVMYGFSRATGPNHTIAAKHPDKVLANLGGGVSPRVNPEDVAGDMKVPTISVIGSADPFAAGPDGVKDLVWFYKNYATYRGLNLPWGAGITWGAGHTPGTGFVMQSAFLKDVIAQRIPADWDPAKGPPAMKDAIAVKDGYLGDARSWGEMYPTIEKAADFKGDAAVAHWQPGSYSAAVWRAYVVKDPAARIEVKGDQVRVAGNIPAWGESATFFNGDAAVARVPLKDGAAGAPVPTGFAHVYAVIDGGGKKAITRPVLVWNGKEISPGEDNIRATQTPLALIELSPAQKATLKTLMERAAYAGPAEWRAVYTDDFSKGIGEWKVGKNLGKTPSKAEVVDGALQLSSESQMLCALPYDFPRDVQVEYRFKAAGEKPNDVGCMINGAETGDRPWREGALMFHVGAAEGQKTAWQVHGETDAADAGPAKPGEWHAVKISRVGDTLFAAVDGRDLPARKLSAGENADVKAHRVGFYTVASTALIDDVKVSVRQPKDPAAVTPAAPAPAELADLAGALAKLLDHTYAEQRDLAGAMVKAYSYELGPALRAVLEKTPPGEKGRARLEQIIKAVRPG